MLLKFESFDSSLSIIYSLGLLALLGLLGLLDVLFGLLHLASLAFLANLLLLLLLLLFLLVFLGFLFGDDFFISLIFGVLSSSDALWVVAVEETLLLELAQDSLHGILVLARLRTRGNKLQALLNLISK